MRLTLKESGSDDLPAHTEIPIAFRVSSVLEPVPGGGPLDFVVRPHPTPWVKDYDRLDGASPALWVSSFDTSAWRVISAWSADSRVGGVVMLAGDAEIEMLDHRSDLALIWDLRVAPAARRRGVGARLIGAAVEWARARGCRELKVETQNINVAACQLYRSQGFELRTVRRDAYPALPDELQMLWYRRLS